LFNIGVPYFFVSSGYFFSGKFFRAPNNLKGKIGVASEYARKLLPLFIFWETFSALRHIPVMFINHEPIRDVVLWIIKAYFIYPNGAMWFVLACMVSVLIVAFLYSKKTILFIWCILGYSFALLCNTYSFVADTIGLSDFIQGYLNIFVSARNGFLVGLVFISLGIYFSRSKKIAKLSNKKVYSITLLLGGGGLLNRF